ncbi:MAG: twin-arginine translocase subunit TatC [Zoogloeaceae bacterium]|jgi:sec-independent protein translocase protein TatC|nr:twin-arginine translocase subunit TatC [Zoogloeaceae bacterium]
MNAPLNESDPGLGAAEESIFSHLIELRTRLIRAILAILIVLLCLLPWARQLYALLALPLTSALPEGYGGTMVSTDVVGGFLVPLKVAAMAAFLIALPYVLYQAWAFVAPGLYQHEKRFALPLLVASVLLFFTGMAFAYYLVFPAVFSFMVAVMPEGVTWMTDIDKYLSFALATFFAFGIAFEVPVVVVLLVKAGVVDINWLKEVRPYAIVGAFVVAAVVTPPDVISQIMLAIPMCLLYEVGIVAARWLVKSTAGEEEDLMSEAELNAALHKAEKGKTERGDRKTGACES